MAQKFTRPSRIEGEQPDTEAGMSYGAHLAAMSGSPSLPKSERTRYALMSATERLLAKKSPSDISINEIVNEASVSRPTLYTYFNDLHHILHVLLLEFAGMAWYDVTSRPRAATMLEGLRRANLRYCRMYAQNAHMYAAHALFAPSSAELLRNGIELNSRLAKRTVARLRATGIKLSDREAREQEANVIMLIAMTEGALRLRYAHDHPALVRAYPTPEAIASAITFVWEKTLPLPLASTRPPGKT